MWLKLLLVLAALTVPSTTTTEHWRPAEPERFVLYGGAISGVPATGTTDGRALRLRLPESPDQGPGGGPGAESTSRFRYGTFVSRLKTANCAAQPNAGVVSGQLFTYFNDGSDYNGNGLPDNSEIDFETLCAEPQVLYLTVWTDYRAADSAQRRVMRAINLRSGKILATCYFTAFGWNNCQQLSGEEASPSDVPAIADFNSATEYHVYGFTWSPTRVTFWIKANGTKITLWDYRGPERRIPHVPAYLLQNVWHAADWTPIDDPGAVERPRTSMSAWVDWTSVSLREG